MKDLLRRLKRRCASPAAAGRLTILDLLPDPGR